MYAISLSLSRALTPSLFQFILFGWPLVVVEFKSINICAPISICLHTFYSPRNACGILVRVRERFHSHSTLSFSLWARHMVYLYHTLYFGHWHKVRVIRRVHMCSFGGGGIDGSDVKWNDERSVGQREWNRSDRQHTNTLVLCWCRFNKRNFQIIGNLKPHEYNDGGS